MANEKSRNHDTGGGKGDTSEHQGKTKDQGGSKSKSADGQKAASKASGRGNGSKATASGKPRPGKQARDQLNVRTDSNSTGPAA